ALQAGPQLVVPISNARYALNAANARWGSLYDALYGTDAISDENGAQAGNTYNPVRGKKVIAFAKNFLDEVAPLVNASHATVEKYTVVDDKLIATLSDGNAAELEDASKFVGYVGPKDSPIAI